MPLAALVFATLDDIVKGLLNHVFGDGGFFSLGIHQSSSVHDVSRGGNALLGGITWHNVFPFLASLQYRHSEIVSPREI